MPRLQKSTKRYYFLVFFLAILLIACKNNSNSFSFIFMTDIHVQPEKRADEGLRTAIQSVNQLKPDFVITGGDLIMDALGQTEGRADSLYDLYMNLTGLFSMPVYNTIGNHEVFGLYEDSGIAEDHPEYGKKMFLQRFKQEKTYQSFDHKGWHFILLDGIGFTPERRYYGYIDSLQLAWLKDDVSRLDKNTPVVLSTHIPLFSVYGQMQNGPTFAMGQGGVVTNALEVMKIFENHNLKLVLQGHLHMIEEIRYRDTTFITGGAVSGRWWNGPRDGFPEGYVLVQVEDGQFSWTYKTYGWKAENTENN